MSKYLDKVNYPGNLLETNPKLLRLNLILTAGIISSFLVVAKSQSLDQLYLKRDSLLTIQNGISEQLNAISIELQVVNNKIELKRLDSLKQSTVIAYTSKTLEARLRDIPSADGKLIQLIPQNSEIKVVDFEGSYFKLIYKEQVGYLNEVFIQKNNNLEEFVNLREDLQSRSAKSYKPNNSASQNKNSYIPKTSKQYYKGPRGGCYYYSKNGKKVYVDRSLCN